MKTNDAKKEKELKTLAKDLTKDKYFRNLSITIMLFSILVISLLPAFFSMGFLLFTVPFLLLPSIFAAQMKMRGAALREEPDYKETLSIFTAYFVAPWRGVYRAFRTILFTALLWSLLSTVSGVVYLGLSTSIDPAFAAAYDVSPAAAGTVCLVTAGADPIVKVDSVFRYANTPTWRVPTGESVSPATHLPAMQDADSLSALKRTKWELSGHGAIRLTRDVQIASLSLASDDGTQKVYTDGFKLTTPALVVNGSRFRSGTYTAETNPEFIVGGGSVTVGGSGFAVFVR